MTRANPWARRTGAARSDWNVEAPTDLRRDAAKGIAVSRPGVDWSTVGTLSSPRERRRILVVDDEAILRETMALFLARRGFDVVEAGSCAEACARIGAESPDGVILDLKLPDGDSIDILPRIRARSMTTPILLLSGFGTIDLAVRALKLGATHFFTKPAPMKEVVEMLVESLGPDRQKPVRAGGPFIGAADAMKRLHEEVARIAESDSPVLILGETGTGKSLLATQLHAMSPRASRPFIDVNCGGLSTEFAQSELFGHERGAFTGAIASKVGLFEAAHLGTLFLDEIGDIDLTVQRHILKALEEKRFRRMGETRERATDVRLVAATHRDLAASMQQQAFRTDLYYRISGFCVTMPALRDRLDDLPGLAAHLVEEICARSTRRAPGIGRRALAELASHAWPGNVRELRNVLERAVWLHRGKEIEVSDIRFDPIERPLLKESGVYRRPPKPDTGPQSSQTMREVERSVIAEALRAHAGHVGEAARQLGIPRSTLYQKLKALGLSTGRRTGSTFGDIAD
ncbi:MAG: sigma-54 dependent transcriptional regulator [Polyangiaceae bacterium]